MTKMEELKQVRSVLIIDDNKNFCDNIKEILELHGYHAITAYDGPEAINLVKERTPDFVLLDVKLPGMDGLAVFRKIKTIAPKTTVVMMTGYSLNQIIDAAIQEGARAALSKPLDFEMLLGLIEKGI
ncbi:MAG: response regulator [Chloroflexi bacterium]|nr:response regulator [Chloroflexota bacterium]